VTPPRIPPLPAEDAAPELRPVFDGFVKERGKVPNMFRTMALLPQHTATVAAHFRTVMGQGTVPGLLKELLWVRISHRNGCRY